jgi:hypothetical protein
MIFGRLSSKRELAQKDKVDLGRIDPTSFAEKLRLISSNLYNMLK